jgi:hypothetical protein
VFVEQTIRDAHHLVVKSVVATFLSTDQEQGGSPLVEGIENSDRFAAALNTELTHHAMPGTSYVARVRKRQHGTKVFKLSDAGVYCGLLMLAQSFPPLSELIGVFDIPCHCESISNVFP